ncbi:MAG: BamA/TamA family outer membrane protein [Deltaproteobacteria bacterium]|nr:BamA/TamA family outer membrane protein [Deltaproteobacteria bacterium]
MNLNKKNNVIPAKAGIQFLKIFIFFISLQVFSEPQELVKINKINFEGLHEFSEVITLKKINLSEYSYVEREEIEKYGNKIKELYKREGFLKAVVIPLLKEEGKNEFNLIFNIQEKNRSIVQSIFVETNNKKELESLLSLVQVKKGDFFIYFELEKNLDIFKNALYEKGYEEIEDLSFGYIQSDKDPYVDVKFIVKTGPKYIYHFEDNETFKNKEILNLKKEQNWTPEDFADKIVEFYKKSGFHFSKVYFSLKEDISQKEKNLFYKIEEGPLVTIEEVFFHGAIFRNSLFYKEYLFEKSKDSLSVKAFYRKSFESGLPVVIEYLGNQGFLKARIDRTQYDFSGDNKKVKIHVYLYEGHQVKISKIQIQGIKKRPLSEIIDVLGVKEGDAFNLSFLERSLTRLKSYYRELGFYYFSLTSEEKIIFATPTNIILDLHFREGPLVTVREIEVKNNHRTKSKVIRRELTFKKEDILRSSSLFESENKLLRLGLFQFVNIFVENEGTQDASKNIVVEVQERKSGLFEFGGGIKTEEGFQAFSGIFYKNLGGWNRTLSFHGDFNRKIENPQFIEREINFGAQEPYLFGVPFIMRLNALNKKKDKRAYDVHTWEGIVSFESKVWDTFRMLFEYHFSFRDIFNTLNPADEEKKLLGVIKPAFYLDYRNNALNPSRGTFHSFGIEYASPLLGSDDKNHFYKLLASTNWYLPFDQEENVVVALALRGGFAQSLLTGSGIPADQRFYLGGRSTIRGFEEDELGVISTTKEITQTYFLNYKTELRFPLFWKIGGAIFVDGGNVAFGGLRAFSSREAAGLGIRYLSPVGPLSFDAGYKLDRQPGESAYQIHFSIGVF